MALLIRPKECPPGPTRGLTHAPIPVDPIGDRLGGGHRAHSAEPHHTREPAISSSRKPGTGYLPAWGKLRGAFARLKLSGGLQGGEGQEVLVCLLLRAWDRWVSPWPAPAHHVARPDRSLVARSIEWAYNRRIPFRKLATTALRTPQTFIASTRMVTVAIIPSHYLCKWNRKPQQVVTIQGRP